MLRATLVAWKLILKESSEIDSIKALNKLIKREEKLYVCQKGRKRFNKAKEA